jgi:hypothetical protein
MFSTGYQTAISTNIKSKNKKHKTLKRLKTRKDLLHYMKITKKERAEWKLF